MFGAEPWTEAMRDAARGRARAGGAERLRAVGDRRPGRRRRVPRGPRRPARAWRTTSSSRSSTPRRGDPVPDGTDGELVFTTLTKEAMPLLRYRTGDIASLNREPCACGRTLRAHERRPRPPRRHADRPRREPLPVRRSSTCCCSVDGVAPHYQLVVERPEQLDEITVHCEPAGATEASPSACKPRDPRADRRRRPRRAARDGRDPAQRGQGRARDRSARLAGGRGSSFGRLAVMPSPEETPRSRRITQGVRYLPAHTACETRERGSERVGEAVPSRRVGARQAERLGGRERRSAGGPSGFACRRSRVPQPAVGGDRVRLEVDERTRRAWPRGRGRPVEVAQPRGGGLGDRVDRHRVGQREREHVRAAPRAASRSSRRARSITAPHAAVRAAACR